MTHAVTFAVRLGARRSNPNVAGGVAPGEPHLVAGHWAVLSARNLSALELVTNRFFDFGRLGVLLLAALRSPFNF